MPNTAIVFAEDATQRRAIASLVKPAGLLGQIYFSSTAKEVAFLLENTRIDLVLCDICPLDERTWQCAAELAELCAPREVPLLLCGELPDRQRHQLATLPPKVPNLAYHSPPQTVAQHLQPLLPASSEARPAPNLQDLIDKGSGVNSRFYFDTFLEQEINRSRLTGRPFSLLLIEPQAAAQVPLQQSWSSLLPGLATTIKEQVRSSDLLCRVELRRFALLLPETSSHNAQQVVRRIRGSLDETPTASPMQINFGLASSGQSVYSRQDLLRQAEANL